MALTAATFATTTFDYLIAGGGTAGLTLAARLTEDPAITVGVIEAGVDCSNDPKVLTPGLASSMWEDPDYDWIFKTVPQVGLFATMTGLHLEVLEKESPISDARKEGRENWTGNAAHGKMPGHLAMDAGYTEKFACDASSEKYQLGQRPLSVEEWIFTNGRVVAHPRGKMLGGSSGINLNLWTHASQKDIDDWGALGNEGWSWADLLPYYRKSENYLSPPADVVEEEDIDFVDPSCHGQGGPVQNKFPPFYSDFYDSWSPTFANLNLSVDGDPKCGQGLGGATTLVTFNETNARSYAGNTYYSLSKNRHNLKVLTNALVTKINFRPKKDQAGNLIATGLSFTSAGNSYTAKASREVLLTAGTFQSPQLLELSGIGSTSILTRNNIPVLYDNPAVGENLQDHLLVPLGFTAAPGESTQEAFRNLTLVQQALELYATDHTGPFAASTPTAYLSYQQLITQILPPADRPPSTPHAYTTNRIHREPGVAQTVPARPQQTLRCFRSHGPDPLHPRRDHAL